PGDDEIEFALEIDGPGIIQLSAGELEITEGLTISGPGQEWLTIDAQRSSRVINITAIQGDFYIGSMTLKNGLTTSENTVDPLGFLTTANGGAIRFIGEGQLTVDDATLTENEVSESDTLGGAIYSGSGKLVVTRTTVKQSVAGRVAGGIYSGTAIGEPGENIVRSGKLEVSQSTISENSSLSGDGSGGGIFSQGNLKLVESTVSGNVTRGIFGGGGIGSASSVEVVRSTIINNHAPFASPSFFGGGLGTQSSTLIESSVIAGNTSHGQAHDLNAQDPSINYSLIGDTTGSGITATSGTGNLLNIDPLLGPLADNGGPTQTHALLPGSPAIDAGDIGIVDPPMYDQRGAPFNRIVDGNVPADVVIDLGAYEAQGVPSADFNTDNALDGFDFL
ncbi:MAG: choice-of-anchor Q domain-containing protein, partial [Lacipirellulaceae bacterium]